MIWGFIRRWCVRMCARVSLYCASTTTQEFECCRRKQQLVESSQQSGQPWQCRCPDLTQQYWSFWSGDVMVLFLKELVRCWVCRRVDRTCYSPGAILKWCSMRRSLWRHTTRRNRTSDVTLAPTSTHWRCSRNHSQSLSRDVTLHLLLSLRLCCSPVLLCFAVTSLASYIVSLFLLSSNNRLRTTSTRCQRYVTRWVSHELYWAASAFERVKQKIVIIYNLDEIALKYVTTIHCFVGGHVMY